ncbi:MAG TPA: hypothetical protein VG168_06260, partial [Bryobacteraceae bacterium]|nr:hypothetical protein [Bryobacteraceae bacterium]
EEFGIHLPRGVTMFISSLGPVASAMEAAFPFLAIIVGATILLEHLAKLKEAGEKLTESQAHFGTTVANVLNGLDEKLLQAGIRTDELNHDHLGALNKQLELIDHQSMDELVHAFDTVAKAADLTFTELKSNWYSFGTGSTGAKHALEEFKTQYESLLAQGKNREAADLLAGTRQSAERVLELQKQAAANQTTTGTHGSHMGDYAKYEAAVIELKKQGTGFTQKEVEAQTTLVEALRAQVDVQDKVNALKQSEKSNAGQSTDNKIAGDNDTAARQQAQNQQKADAEIQKLWDENYRRAVSALEQNEREKIDATKQGSAARLAAIDAAIKDENAKGLQETGFYKSLLTDRVNVARQMADEEAKQKEEAGKESAEHAQKMGELVIAAEREQAQLKMSVTRTSAQERMTSALQFANEEYALHMSAFAKEMAALDKNDKDYENKLKAFQDKETELTRQHENQTAQIKSQSAAQQQAQMQQAWSRMENGAAQSLMSVMEGHRTFAKEMSSIMEQVTSSILTAAIAEANGLESTKLTEAKAAARKMYLAGTHFPWPMNIVMAPTLGAIGFASMMAFEGGGIVPGVEFGDVVSARLEPGETVLPKQMTEKLNSAAGSADSNRPHVHVHINNSHTIHALDSQGMDRVLDKHGDKLQRHFERTVRKMNK